MRRSYRDPGDWLADLRADQERGTTGPLLPFFGHRPDAGTPGPRHGGLGPWVLSQWWPVIFTVEGVRYPHAEAFMMAEKARLFGDTAVREQILAGVSPKQAKVLGRAVRGYDEQTWAAARYRVVLRGTWAKFAQHENLRGYLAATAPAVLVEASPYDRVWGIGLAATNPAACAPTRWRGTNLLGFALTEVRDALTG